VIEMSMTDVKSIEIHVSLPKKVYNELCDVVKKKEGKVSRKINKHAVLAIEDYIKKNK
jgi:hypothetical protein